MPIHLEKLLPAAAADSKRNDPRPPRGMNRRLNALAALLSGAPADVDGRGRLVWRNEHKEVMALAVTRQLVVGRAAGCDLTFASPRVSRCHCTVIPGLSSDELIDHNSTNGTLVNGARVRRHTLQDGDLIELGGERMAYARQ